MHSIWLTGGEDHVQCLNLRPHGDWFFLNFQKKGLPKIFKLNIHHAQYHMVGPDE